MNMISLRERMLIEAGFVTRKRDDGGPGSGNHGHKGVPGQLGGSAPGNGSRKTVSGKDISKTYSGKTTTKDVLKAQGFDGLPKILSRKEFDEAVKSSKFIAQRTYAASSQEILDAYHDQLMNGDFYVECTEGGSQYGQGMYCAADYTGKLSEGIKAEMEHYIALGKTRNSPKDSPHRQEVADMQSEEADKIYRDAIEEKIKDFTGDEAFIFKCYSLHNSTPEEQSKAFEIMGKWSKEKMDSFYKKASDAVEDAQAQMSAVKNIPLHEYAKAHGIEIESDPVHQVETLTLDPSAKIVSYDEISRMQEEEGSKFRDSELASYSQNAGPECEALFRIETGKTQSGDFGIVTKWQTEHPEEFKKAEDFYISAKTKASEMLTKFVKMDPGAYAALKGYDAINAKGHGESGSYTVILNRTKTIFLDTDEHADRRDGDNTITFQEGEDGVIYAIRDREVIGWVSTSAPSAENNSDSGEDGKKSSKSLDKSAKKLYNDVKSIHSDVGDKEPEWITVNGAHIPLIDDKAVAGTDIKGEDFSSAQSQESESKTSSSQSRAQATSSPRPSASKFAGKKPSEFSKAVVGAKKKGSPETVWRVTAHTQEELEADCPDAKLHITDGGSTFAINGEDIISVCGTPEDRKNGIKGRQLIEMAVEAGGKKLDSYDGNHGFYVKCGFEPVSWCKWDDNAADEGWINQEWLSVNGLSSNITTAELSKIPDSKLKVPREDVVFYKYTGNRQNFSFPDEGIELLKRFKDNTPASKDYDTALKARDDKMK